MLNFGRWKQDRVKHELLLQNRIGALEREMRENSQLAVEDFRGLRLRVERLEAGQPPATAEAPPSEIGSTTTGDRLGAEVDTTAVLTPELQQSVRVALNAGRNSVSLVGVCPYCEHELLIPVSVAVAET